MSSQLTATGLVGGADTNAVAIGAAGGVASLCFQSLPGADWTGWGPLAKAPTTFKCVAIAGIDAGDVMAAAATGVDGALYYADSPAGTGWSGSWTRVGRPTTSLGRGCAIAMTPAGTAYVAAVGTDNGLWIISRPPGRPWSEWTRYAPPAGLAPKGTCALAVTSGGKPAMVANFTDGKIHALLPTIDGKWTDVGRPSATPLEGPVALTAGPDSRLTVFAVGDDGNGYIAPITTADTAAVFSSVGRPKAAQLSTGAWGTGLLAGPGGVLVAAAAGIDGRGYGFDSRDRKWTPLAIPGASLPLRSVPATGAQQYSVNVAAPSATTSRGTAAAAGRPQLHPGTIMLDNTFSLPVEEGTYFLVAAVQDAEGEPHPGVGLVVTRPDGTLVDKPSDPDDRTTVVQLNESGDVISMLLVGPQVGQWTAKVVGAGADDDFQATLTTLPAFDVQPTIATTLTGMIDPSAADTAGDPTATAAWACIACRFGAYAGALLVAGAIAYGVTLLAPESAVVLWLAALVGANPDKVLAFIVGLSRAGIKAVPAIVTAICKYAGACPTS